MARMTDDVAGRWIQLDQMLQDARSVTGLAEDVLDRMAKRIDGGLYLRLLNRVQTAQQAVRDALALAEDEITQANLLVDDYTDDDGQDGKRTVEESRVPF